MTAVTDPLPAHPPRPSAPGPADYDAPRNVIARDKGLEGAVITGGDDPDLAATVAAERRYWRLLKVMVVGIVASGFVIGILIALAGPAGGR